ncbi:di-trans,poly-cis-decaprenylcistransferase [candidate division KSB1 bacterium RBG_16_48_16]|nr:MAG: di-trans,poly-cis-decaprenylcistransferase [candidate division KSB1 bacterium RBG_16_48_16]
MIDDQRVEKIKKSGNLPQHIAIIMDGNGRWAKSKGLSRVEGHKCGVESVRAVVESAGALNLRALTLYTFSSENWARPKSEISALMSLIVRTVKNEVDELDKNNVRLTVIGDIDALPPAPRLGVKNTIERLRKNTGLIVNLALSYGGRQEIVEVAKALAQQAIAGEVEITKIDEELFKRQLQTSWLGDPDLLIRTGGEMRISNFLLWQMAYTEMYFTEKYWPDFRHDDFFDAIEIFQHRERRFGKVSEQLAR